MPSTEFVQTAGQLLPGSDLVCRVGWYTNNLDRMKYALSLLSIK